MATPTETVMDFLKLLEKPGGFPDAIRAYFTPTTRYLNVGMSDTTGVDDTLVFIEQFMAGTRTSWMVAEMLALGRGGRQGADRADRPPLRFRQQAYHVAPVDGHIRNRKWQNLGLARLFRYGWHGGCSGCLTWALLAAPP